MEQKPPSSSFFKRLSKKASGSAWRWMLKSSGGLRWKKRFSLRLRFVDDVLFKIASAFESVVLVSALCFFFLCCGCHF